MSEFGERLGELLFENNLNEKQFAEKLGICVSSVSVYLQGKSLPTVESLVKIADYFKCTTDFLLGREEESKVRKFKPCPPFSEQILFLKKHFKCSAYKIYHNTKIAKTSYYEWVGGERQPKVENVINLADIFECSVDFVLGREV